MSCKGVTLSNIEWCFEDEGQKYEVTRDRQGRAIRQAQQKYEEDLIEYANKTRTDG
jgi:hypothetical protein